MSTRVKFLLLIFSSFTAIVFVLILVLSTDYAKNEWAYFKTYPYVEMAAREKRNIPEATEILTATLPPREPTLSPEIITPLTQAYFPEALNIKQPIILTHRAPIKPPEKQLEKQPEKKIISPVSPAPAIIHTQKRHNNDPVGGTWIHAAKKGYEAYNDAEYATAITYFKRALKIAPHNYDIHLQLAYAYKKTGQNSLAVKNFKSAIDQTPHTIPSFSLRREVEQLNNHVDVNGYIIYRDESSSDRQLGADLTQSQAGVEISYQPENTVLNNGHTFQIYARFLSGMKPDQLTLNPDSYQAGMGIRIKPLSGHNLVLSAERLIKVGDFARNDWMIRGGYSLDHRTDYREDKTKWWSYSLYLDAALIDPGDPDIFLTSQITSGYNMVIAQGLILQPRLTGLATWQKDSFHEASLFEAGPGLNMRYHFNDTKYQAFRSYVDLTIEYRKKLSGNSIGGSGPIASLLLHF